ncbi:MAG TPA: diaminopimelate decarboxylase [Trichormus sp.]
MDIETEISPNVSVRPATAQVNAHGHLVVGGCDTVELAREFGTPLYVIDAETIRRAAAACLEGLQGYPNTRVLYAGKAFLCLAMCKLVQKLGLGLDVVSEGELYTATRAGFPPELTYLHGNNKSQNEIDAAIKQGINIVIDNKAEAEMVAARARSAGKKTNALIRVTPGVEPETHRHIKTGQHDSKFGVPLEEVLDISSLIAKDKEAFALRGLHVHIGSLCQDLTPFLDMVDILADLVLQLKTKEGIEIEVLDVGGGLGIAYTDQDHPAPMAQWSKAIAERVKKAFSQRGLALPTLMVEPGRAIIGTSGLTLYRAGFTKMMGEKRYLAVDGGMADNPRPITYDAVMTAAVANRMNTAPSSDPLTLVGRYCESGDIIIKVAYLDARPGDLIALFGTGAYNYSQASNYNRTPRPACIMVNEGSAEIIIERETNEDLIRQDRIPKSLSEGIP